MSKPPVIVTLFGVTGDLSQKKLLPALAYLVSHPSPEESPNKGFAIVGYGRRPWTTLQFRQFVQTALIEFGVDEAEIKQVLEKSYYIKGAFDSSLDFSLLAENLNQIENQWAEPAQRLFYLAVAPEFFIPITEHLAKTNLNQHATFPPRLLIEKPFGVDEYSAHELNQKLQRVFPEEQIFRIDHYLSKTGVEVIPKLEQGPELLAALPEGKPNAVMLTLAEDFGIGNRGAYYDQSGVLRDVVQNHALELLALLIMNPNIRDIRQARTDALRSITIQTIVTGQYNGYKNEAAVLNDSHTATFAALKATSRLAGWEGTSFYIRAGKNLAQRTTHLVLLWQRDLQSTRLTLQLTPAVSVIVEKNHKKYGSSITMPYEDVSHLVSSAHIDNNYANLLADAIAGRTDRFIGDEEVEAAWRAIAPALAYAKKNPPLIYTSGTWGPPESNDLVKKDGFTWLN